MGSQKRHIMKKILSIKNKYCVTTIKNHSDNMPLHYIQSTFIVLANSLQDAINIFDKIHKFDKKTEEQRVSCIKGVIPNCLINLKNKKVDYQ